MEPDDHLRALRRHWWVPLLCAVIAVVAGVAFSGEPPERSSARVVVGAADDLVGEGARFSATESIDAELMNTMADLLTSAVVVDAASEQAGVTRGDLTVRATVGPESHVVTVSVEGPDGEDARALTDAIVAEGSARFLDLYDIYEVQVLAAAGSPTSPGPSRVASAAIAGLIGLAFGAALVVGVNWLRHRGSPTAPS